MKQTNLEQKEFADIEIAAQKWLDETDIMQFSQMELLAMFHAHELNKSKKCQDFESSERSPGYCTNCGINQNDHK